MKRLLKVALLVLIAATTITAQKEGNVIIRANVPVRVWIADNGPGTTPLNAGLSPGDYTVRFELPDGSTTERTLTVRKNCTTRLDVTYKPPTCPTCAPAVTPTPTVVPTPTPEPEPEFEFKPEPVPTRFDQCCGCKRDDLKARLDLFAIQLHSNPAARGAVIADTEEAINYLVNQRRVDRARLELQSNFRFKSNCVELWILP